MNFRNPSTSVDLKTGPISTGGQLEAQLLHNTGNEPSDIGTSVDLTPLQSAAEEELGVKKVDTSWIYRPRDVDLLKPSSTTTSIPRTTPISNPLSSSGR